MVGSVRPRGTTLVPGRKHGPAGVDGLRYARTRTAISGENSRTLPTYRIRYILPVLENEQRKPVVWLHGRVKTPPFSTAVNSQCKQRLRAYEEACRKAAER